MGSLFLFQCTPRPPILTSTLSLDLPSGAGTSSSANFTEFSSLLSSGITTLTFSSQDGDILEFKVNGLHPGANYDINGANTLTGTLKITDEVGQLTVLQIEGTGVGFLRVDGMTGTGSNIQGMAGAFQVNIQVAGSTQEPGQPTTTGTIVGNIGFNKQAE